MKKLLILVCLILSLGVNALAVSLLDGTVSDGQSYAATGDDESAIDVSGNAEVTVTGAKINKLEGSASSADAASFRGVNAAVRVYDSAALTLSGSTIEASAPNATGVFAYGGGTVIISDSTVDVTGGGAGGVQVAGGGTLIGENLTVTSASKAAIRSDRGGGTLVLDGGTYTSTGKNGCPAIYSTADITVKNAVCVSQQSRAVIIEGKNSVTLENCVLEGNDQSSKEGSVRANVLLYQSASGDASVGTSVFTMIGGQMKCASGAMFYCTNTSGTINLSGAELLLSEDETLLIVSEGRWGKEGKNGGSCVVNAENQALSGKILVDDISSLALNLNASGFTGSIASDGKVSVTLDADSVWTLTADSYITEFHGSLENVKGDYTLYVNGKAVN
ncbi:MAG: right-handed parallel beta-helix repeat-containing protein [Clostridia bacterium]|nr:right-handed parallel beta-helix repeat-containing protein [Clostridia bacterium]